MAPVAEFVANGRTIEQVTEREAKWFQTSETDYSPHPVQVCEVLGADGLIYQVSTQLSRSSLLMNVKAMSH